MQLSRLQLGENAKMALKTVRENKTRSFLTVLGVVIGITTLIAVASIMVGLDQDMRGFLTDFGPETLFVFKFTPGIHIGRLSQEERSRKPLTLEDVVAIRQQCPAVEDITAELYPRIQSAGPPQLFTARYQNHEINNVDFSGALASYQDVYNIRVERGRYFSEAEDMHREDVAVIGHDVAETFFGASDPLGKSVLVDSVPYRVIGVEKKHAGSFFKDQSTDRALKIPYRSYQKHYPTRDEHFVGVKPYPGMKAAAEDQVREVLRQPSPPEDVPSIIPIPPIIHTHSYLQMLPVGNAMKRRFGKIVAF